MQAADDVQVRLFGDRLGVGPDLLPRDRNWRSLPALPVDQLTLKITQDPKVTQQLLDGSLDQATIPNEAELHRIVKENAAILKPSVVVFPKQGAREICFQAAASFPSADPKLAGVSAAFNIPLSAFYDCGGMYEAEWGREMNVHLSPLPAVKP